MPKVYGAGTGYFNFNPAVTKLFLCFKQKLPESFLGFCAMAAVFAEYYFVFFINYNKLDGCGTYVYSCAVCVHKNPSVR